MILTLTPETISTQTIWSWPLVLTLPLLFAGAIIEKTASESSLADEQSYRSNLSDIVIESSEWRGEQQDGLGWRDPSPANRWRTDPKPSSGAGSTKRRIELFPKYRPGDPAAFDHSTREEKGQIKVFEFGH